MEYITEKEEILENIKWRNFFYDCEVISINGLNIPILKVTIIDNGKEVLMQPFLLGDIEYIEKCARLLWQYSLQQYPEKRNSSSRNFSLKLDVIKPVFEHNIRNSSHKHILEIGSSESFLSTKIVNDFFSGNYIGLDITTPEKRCDFSYLLGLIEQLPFTNESIDFVLISMVLLNIVRPEIALAEISRVLSNKSNAIIIDINSNYYKACGFYKKEGENYLFTKVLNTEKSFFTLKVLGRNNFFVHCYHCFDLYRNILVEHGFKISNDFVFGPSKEIIKSRSPNYTKDINLFSRYINYEPFRFIKAKRHKCH
ncbi:class I SAM-dependent methyltransferase [bacterium]|nr:class I SAM-dependent methyltransferase [bacterium]